jgi:hypothetical protein
LQSSGTAIDLGGISLRSTYLPRWLGWLLFVDGWAWVLDSVSIYLFPGASLGFLRIFFGVELVFMVWLLGWRSRIRAPLVADSPVPLRG